MDYQKILTDLKNYCISLIIYQYQSSLKNQAIIKRMVDLIFANNLALQVRDLTLNVELSEGKQLDDIGEWVGINRYYDNKDWTHPYLSFPLYPTIEAESYDDNQGGFSTYNNFADNDGGFLMYQAIQDNYSQVNALGDPTFRALIRLKIIKNSINATCGNIDRVIWKWSDGHVYITWGIMELTYHYPQSMADLMVIAKDKNVLLAPIGCKINMEAY